LPGGEGFLGVCFGRVITANSPASQADHPTNWQAVLWHEFCHVVTLSKTRNKMPRWLSEGISVYEERQRDPTWGQAINPRYRSRLLADDLTPVSRLSAAFLKPRTPLDLQFAYFESSLVVQFIVERYGQAALEKILADLADDVPIGPAIANRAAPLERLDADFAAYARAQAEAFAPQADWSDLELPPDADLAALAEWNAAHPRHFEGLQRQAAQLMADKKWNAARPVLAELLKIYPAAALPMLARAHRELNDPTQERADLESLAGLNDAAVDAFTRLMELAAAAADWPAVERNAERMLAVNPLAAAPYRQLARAAETLGHVDGAIRASRALLLLDTADPSENHYRLARLYFDKKDLPAARRHVLQSLEETPRYRAAQRLLLDIARSSPEESP
jgi:tetratricopeptide (TPR) repeat protein